MPYTEIFYAHNTYYKGRNGVFTQVGLVINVTDKLVSLYPLNTRGYTDACIMTFPASETDRIAEALKEIVKKHELPQV